MEPRYVATSCCSLAHRLPGQHVLQVCHHIGHHSPQRGAEVHLSRVLHSHGVALAVMEPEVAAICHMEAGT